MQVLVGKGFVRHEKDGKQYIYFPTITMQKAENNALQHVLMTFFNNSVGTAVAALLELPGAELDDGDIKKIQKMIKSARGDGRKSKGMTAARRK